MKATKDSLAYLHRAFSLIEQDNGFHHYERILHHRDCDYNERTYDIPEEYQELAVTANASLSVMTNDEIEILCTGEFNDQQKIVSSYASDGQIVNKVLNAFFDGWN